MRIVYIHQYFVTRESQGGTRSYEFARRLALAGHEVHIVTANSRKANNRKQPKSETIDGFRVHWLRVPYSNQMGYFRRILAFLDFAIKASWLSRALNGDIIYATSTPLTIIIPAYLASIFKNVPIIFEVRDLWPSVPISLGALRSPILIRASRSLEMFAYLKARHIVALSPDMKTEIVKLGILENKISVIPNSSDRDLFAVDSKFGLEWRLQHPKINTRPIVLYCGTFGKVNGVQYLARLAAEIRKFDTTIVFVAIGDGAEKQLVIAEAEKLGVLEENFFVLPAVSKREVVTAFSAADVIISTVIPVKELEANSANKVFDGLAANKPIVINYGGWQQEFLEDEGAGLRLPYEALDMAARMLSEFMNSETQMTKAKQAATKLARTKFDRDLLSDKLLDVITDVSNESPEKK